MYSPRPPAPCTCMCHSSTKKVSVVTGVLALHDYARAGITEHVPKAVTIFKRLHPRDLDAPAKQQSLPACAWHLERANVIALFCLPCQAKGRSRLEEAFRWKSPTHSSSLQVIASEVMRSDLPGLSAKATSQNPFQIEIKITHVPGTTTTTVDSGVYLFFPKELEAVTTGFYGSLWENVRVKVKEASQDSREADTLQLRSVTRLLGFMGHDTDLITEVNHQLQIQAWSLREALHSVVVDVQEVTLKYTATTHKWLQAKQLLEAVTSRVFSDVDALNQEYYTVPEVKSMWRLSEEWLLHDIERVLLKLLCDMDSWCERQWQIQSQQTIGAAEKPQAFWDTRHHVLQSILHIQEMRHRQGYYESEIQPDDPFDNEVYVYRVKTLKRHAQASLDVTLKIEKQSMLLHDLVGATVAGIAMAEAMLTLWICVLYGLKQSQDQVKPEYMFVLIAGYMLKDRIKEWGKRYLQPVAEWCGMTFPDRSIHLEDRLRRPLGTRRETCRIRPDSAINNFILQQRQQKTPAEPCQAPENVLVFKASMTLDWRKLRHSYNAVGGLVDIFRIDLRDFCRRMEPPMELHHVLTQSPAGACTSQRIRCVRAYRLHLVLQVETSVPEATDKLVHQQSFRITLNRDGVLRVE